MNVMNIGFTALNSFEKVQEVVSNNVANVNTDNYNRKDVVLEEMPKDQGVRVQEVREERNNNVNQTQNAAEQNQRTEQNNLNIPQNNVDLAKEFTKMIQNQNAYNANAQVVRTGNEMVGELINKIV